MLFLRFLIKNTYHYRSLTTSDGLSFQFATDGEGNYGYLKGDDTFVPFSSCDFDFDNTTIVETKTNSVNFDLQKGKYFIIGYGFWASGSAVAGGSPCDINVTSGDVDVKKKHLTNGQFLPKLFVEVLSDTATFTFSSSGAGILQATIIPMK